MSVINSRQAKPDLLNVSIASSAQAFCNANTALQNAMRKLGSGVKSSFLLRCGELPFVQGDEESIESVFLEVIQLILAKKDTSTKIYLHINATIDDTEAIEFVRTNNLSRYFIQFHTNITPCAEWMKNSREKISNLTALLAPFGGSLTVNQLKNSGCIISVVLPGKL